MEDECSDEGMVVAVSWSWWEFGQWFSNLEQRSFISPGDKPGIGVSVPDDNHPPGTL